MISIAHDVNIWFKRPVVASSHVTISHKKMGYIFLTIESKRKQFPQSLLAYHIKRMSRVNLIYKNVHVLKKIHGKIRALKIKYLQP